MHCSFCGATIPEGSSFCPSCGREVPAGAQRACGNCGQPLRSGLKFCTSCGTPVAAIPFQTPVSAATGAATFVSQQSADWVAGHPQVEEERKRKRKSPLLFWIPFSILLLLAVFLFWAGKTTVVGWAILMICFLLLFLLRGRILMAGALASMLGWVAIIIVLFLTMGFTASSEKSVATAGSAGNSRSAVAAPTTTAAPKSGTSASATVPAARPTATTLKMDPPAQLKPLILSAAKPTNRLQYQVYLDGDRSYATLSYDLSAGTLELSNFTGDTSWSPRLYFWLDEERAKSHFQSQLKTTREDQGFKDDLGIFLPRQEATLGKGDESFGFTRAWKDQPRAAMSTFVVRQGASWFYITTTRDTQNPVVPADGIDLLLAEMKKIDNKALIASAQGGASAIAPQPAAKPTPAPAPTSKMRVENLAVGLGLDKEQRIQNPTNILKPDVPQVFLSVELRNVTQEVGVEVQWVYLGTNEVVKGPTQKMAADGRLGFSLTRPTNGWPAGQYRALVLLNGQEAAAVGFSAQP